MKTRSRAAGLAGLLAQLGDLAAAGKMYEEVWQGMTDALPTGDPATVRVKAALEAMVGSHEGMERVVMEERIDPLYAPTHQEIVEYAEWLVSPALLLRKLCRVFPATAGRRVLLGSSNSSQRAEGGQA